MPASDRQPKQLVDKLQLREWVTYAHPSGSPLPNHVDRLDSLKCPPRPRLRIGWVEQRLTKESLDCCGMAFGREQEIDGLTCGIHGSVQISVLPLDPDVGFIDAIAFIGPFQVSAAALVQFRPLDLDPAPDATGVDEQTGFERHLGHVRKGNRKRQVPPHTPENDIARIMTSFEGFRRGNGHVSPYQMPIRFFHTIPETIARIEEMPDQIVLMRREGKPKDNAGLTSPSRRASLSTRQARSRPCSGIWHQSPHRAPAIRSFK